MIELRKTNIVLRRVIKELEKASKQNDAPIWERVAEELSKQIGRAHV